MLTVVAYYTRGTPYEQEAALLRASLEAVGMEHLIVGVNTRGDWNANTARKPELLRRWRDMLSGPLLYLDVDAFVHQDCTAYFEGLATAGWDFGLHYFWGPAFGHNRTEVQKEGWWPLTGTLFLGDTDGCMDILDRWCAINETRKARGDMAGGGQKNLQYLLPALEKMHRIARIPGRYCFVYDKPWAYPHAFAKGCCAKRRGHQIHRAEPEPRIIEHTIASRENRRPGETNRRLIESRQNRTRELRSSLI